MAVLLSIFDTRLGPVSFMTIPKHFNEQVVKKTVKLMDFIHDDDFLIQEHPEHGIKSINMPITIPSKWARGQVEIAQISIMTTEESPQVESFKRSMVNFKEQVLKEPDIYMAFYTGNRKEYIPAAFFTKPEGKAIDPRGVDDLIAAKHEKLAAMLDALHDEVRIETPATYAYVTSINQLAVDGHVPVPRSAMNELKELARSRGVSNAFTVFRKVGDMLKADVIPCSGQAILVRIIVKELTPEFIMRTSQVIALPLLFTSGICQEKAGKCSYEAYFSVAGDVEKTIARVQRGVSALDKVVSVDIRILA
jgi:hypothetical protein